MRTRWFWRYSTEGIHRAYICRYSIARKSALIPSFVSAPYAVISRKCALVSLIEGGCYVDIVYYTILEAIMGRGALRGRNLFKIVLIGSGHHSLSNLLH